MILWFRPLVRHNVTGNAAKQRIITDFPSLNKAFPGMPQVA